MENETGGAPRGKGRGTVLKIAAIAALIATGAGAYAFIHRGEESTDDAAFEATVVTVSPKVSGYVRTLAVTDNQYVHAGDLIAEIDPADYRIRKMRAEAVLAAAKASLQASAHTLQGARVQAPSEADAARAQVASAQAEWENAQRTLKRLRSLSDQARSRQQLEDAVAAQAKAQSAVNDARARLKAAETAPETIATAESNAEQLAAVVRQAEADLAQADRDLGDTRIVAPIDGRVANRGVERGNYVQPGQQMLSLVGADLWVVANFKETQLAHMRPGQKAGIGIDAYPDLDVTGTVDSIQAGTGARFSAFPPQNATGNFVKIVQRVPVRILLDRPIESRYAVGPGMSVVPTVHTR